MASTMVTVIQAEIEETLKRLAEPEFILAYALYNPDAVPIKFEGPEIFKKKQVVQYAALISSLLLRTKINIRSLPLVPQDTELQTIRIRTARDTELIISHVSDNFMLVIQQCEGRNKQATESKEEVKEVQLTIVKLLENPVSQAGQITIPK